MRKVKRKILGVILTLAMVLGMCPVVGVYADGQEDTAATYELVLDNGEYTDSYKATYGTVLYKTSDDSWTELSSLTGSENGSSYKYNLPRVNGNTYIKLTSINDNYEAYLAGDNQTLSADTEIELSDKNHLEFRSKSGNQPQPGNPEENQSIGLTLDNGGMYDSTYTSTYGTIEYKNGENWAGIEGLPYTMNGNKYCYNLPKSDGKVTIKVIVNSGYTATLMGNPNVDVISGQEIELTDNYNLEFTSENTGGGGNPAPNPGGNEECIGFAFEGEMGTDYSALVKNGIELYVAVSSDETKPAESAFEKLSTLVTNGNVTQADGAYKFASDADQVYAYLKYDDSKYMSQAGPGSLNIGVGYENASKISTTGINTIQVDKIHYTVTWAYDAKRFGEDAYLEHGKAYITAINGVSVDKLTFDAIWGDNPGNADGGNLAVEAGSTVTVKLIPDYGYQLKSVSLNGNELTPQSDVSTFTFKMPATQVHFKGAFEKSTDVITTQGVTVANAIINNASNATDSGNISLEVKDNSTYKTGDAEALVTDSVSAEAVDLNLNQIVSKGNGSSWETAITEFSKPVTLTLGLKNYDSSYDYTVVRNHNGQLTRLDTSVSDGKVSFETNQFSTYIIVKSEKKKVAIIGTGTSMGEGAPETKLSQSADELLGLIGLTDDELAAIKEMGADADLTLGIESTNPSSQELALIKNVLGKNSIAEYYDISLLLKVEGLGQRQITDPDGKIKIAITIPEKFLNTDKNVKRTYRMVRIHDGKATVIEGSFDAVTKQFTFETDAFSTYALVYEDTAVSSSKDAAATSTPKPSNTSTKVKKAVKGGDSNNLMVWYTVLLLGVAGITTATLYRRRKNK